MQPVIKTSINNPSSCTSCGTSLFRRVEKVTHTSLKSLVTFTPMAMAGHCLSRSIKPDIWLLCSCLGIYQLRVYAHDLQLRTAHLWLVRLAHGVRADHRIGQHEGPYLCTCGPICHQPMKAQGWYGGPVIHVPEQIITLLIKCAGSKVLAVCQ